MIIQTRTDFSSHIFREIFTAVCWTVWNTRNGVIFYNKAASVATWRIAFKEFFFEEVSRGAPYLYFSFFIKKAKDQCKAKQSIAGPLNLWRESFH
jgi:hypothetical protein